MFFNLSFDGPRLRPVLFGSCANMSYKRNYHSFIRDVVYGRWNIASCRKYLWGVPFHLLFDCSTIKEVIEYNGSIHQLKH